LRLILLRSSACALAVHCMLAAAPRLCTAASPLRLSPQRRARASRPSHAARTVAMAAPPRIGFLGAGMMAEALAKGFVNAGVATASGIVATDIAQARKDVFAAAGMAVVETSREVRALRAVCAHLRRAAQRSAAHATLPG
jgi:hypothetical protein